MKNSLQSKRRRSGFMLVEAMISIVLLVTVLGFTLSIIGRAKRHAAINNDRIKALNLARQDLESIRQWRYSSTYLSLGTHTYPLTNTYVVSSNAYFGTNFIKDVTMTVSYTGALSQVVTVKLVTSMSSVLHQ